MNGVVKLAGLAAGLLLGLPALAQDARRGDLASIETCIAENAGRDRLGLERFCMGRVAEPCLETPEGQTTHGINQCYGRETAAWDVLLNRAWPDLRARAREMDLGNDVAAMNLPSADRTLLAAQRAWLAWRDAECAAQAAEWGMGSFRTNIHAFCWHKLTATRAIEFLVRMRDRE